MSPPQKILVVGDARNNEDTLLDPLRANADVVVVQSMLRALSALKRDDFSAVYVDTDHLKDAFQVGRLLQNERILEGLPEGVVLLAADNAIIWGNGRLREWSGRDNIIGENFYKALGSPEILGPDFCPFQSALSSNSATQTTLRDASNRYYHIHVTPVRDAASPSEHLLVTVRDITVETLQQQKLAAIHQAGVELADLQPDQLVDMDVEGRIELLKARILDHTKDLLHFDVVELRLLDVTTGKLEPLLAEGIKPEAARRDLYAMPQNNGVTGFVAATGKSYLCEDTNEDPLYLEGASGARSSLTVPLILHDDVIGTFNVESPNPRAFSESDLQFLEIFTRDVAVALNTLELLVAEKASSTAASVEAIHSAVALPVDDILNDAVHIMERYIGHEPEVVERVQRILTNARDIKQVIQKVGQNMTPSHAHPQSLSHPERPRLRGRTVLVADADEGVRSAAHALLERYGCIVETAHDGAEAIFMVRNMSSGSGYDAILADIRLPDMAGCDFMVRLEESLEGSSVPLILMTGFGYDPSHSIVKARRAGHKSVLYKPFRLDQLLETVEEVIGEVPVS